MKALCEGILAQDHRESDPNGGQQFIEKCHEWSVQSCSGMILQSHDYCMTPIDSSDSKHL